MHSVAALSGRDHACAQGSALRDTELERADSHAAALDALEIHVDDLANLEQRLRDHCGDVKLVSEYGEFGSLAELRDQGPGIGLPLDFVCESQQLRIGFRPSCPFIQTGNTLEARALGRRFRAFCRERRVDRPWHMHFTSWVLWTALCACVALGLCLLALVWPQGLPKVIRFGLSFGSLFVVLQAWMNEPEWLTERARFKGPDVMQRMVSVPAAEPGEEDAVELMDLIRTSSQGAKVLSDSTGHASENPRRPGFPLAVRAFDPDATIVWSASRITMSCPAGAKKDPRVLQLRTSLKQLARRNPTSTEKRTLGDRIDMWRRSPLRAYGVHKMLLWLVWVEFTFLLAADSLASAAGWLPGMAALLMLGIPDMVIDNRVWIRAHLEIAVLAPDQYEEKPPSVHLMRLPRMQMYLDDLQRLARAVQQYSEDAVIRLDGSRIADTSALADGRTYSTVEMHSTSPWVRLRCSPHGNWFECERGGLQSEGLAIVVGEVVRRCRVRAQWSDRTLRFVAASSSSAALVIWGVAAGTLGLSQSTTWAIFGLAIATIAWSHWDSWERRARAFRLSAFTRPDPGIRLRGLV